MMRCLSIYPLAVMNIINQHVVFYIFKNMCFSVLRIVHCGRGFLPRSGATTVSFQMPHRLQLLFGESIGLLHVGVFVGCQMEQEAVRRGFHRQGQSAANAGRRSQGRGGSPDKAANNKMWAHALQISNRGTAVQLC